MMLQQDEPWKSVDAEKGTTPSVANATTTIEDTTAPPTPTPSKQPFTLDTEVRLLGDNGATVVRTVPASHLQRTRGLPNIGDAVAFPLALKLCQYFEESGACHRGRKCRFAHDAGPPSSDQGLDRHAPARPAPRGAAASKTRNPPPPTHSQTQQAASDWRQPRQHQQRQPQPPQNVVLSTNAGWQPAQLVVPNPAYSSAPGVHQPPAATPPDRHRMHAPSTSGTTPAATTVSPSVTLLHHHHHHHHLGGGYYIPVAYPSAVSYFPHEVPVVYNALPSIPQSGAAPSPLTSASPAPPVLMPSAAGGGYTWSPFAASAGSAETSRSPQPRQGTW